MSTPPLTIVGVADPVYLPRLSIMVASVLRNAPTARLYLHLINVSPDDAASLKGLSSTIDIFQEEVTGLAKGPHGPFATYCALARIRAIAAVLERGDHHVLYLDADAIVRKSLAGIVYLLEGKDGLILRQATVHQVSGGPEDRFAAGVVALRNTLPARTFVARWMELGRAESLRWTADQVSYAGAYEEGAGGAVIGNLPFRYIDWRLSFSSPIWIGKKSVADSPMYRLEAERYTRPMSRVESLTITLRQVPYRIVRSLWEVKNALFSGLGRLRRAVVPRAVKEDHQ